jgi:Uma2 family endonuclease
MRWNPSGSISMANRLPTRTEDEILYPSSDGQPVAETDLHIEELLTFRSMMRLRYRERDDVYVAGNLLVYYEKGNPNARVAPDGFVVFGVPARNRRVFKTWQEQAAPSFVIEFTSRGTWLEDFGNKKALYAGLGVEEYFQFDPEADYLDPPLQAQRLIDGEYRPIGPRADGGIESQTLRLIFYRDGARLRLVDLDSGRTLLRPSELHSALLDAERAKNEAETRAETAEAELAQLRAELDRSKR